MAPWVQRALFVSYTNPTDTAAHPWISCTRFWVVGFGFQIESGPLGRSTWHAISGRANRQVDRPSKWTTLKSQVFLRVEVVGENKKRLHPCGYLVRPLRFRVGRLQALGSTIWRLGFRVEDLRFRVWGPGFSIQLVGFRLEPCGNYCVPQAVHAHGRTSD